MRIAVVGGTGLVGRFTVDALRRRGQDVVVLSRSRGVDVATGKGLDDTLVGVDALVDVMSAEPADAEAARKVFGGATRNLLAAGQRARVKHHVLLSIAGIHRVEGNAHCAGKRAQEELVSAGPVPWTIQPATQFHEFA